MEKKINKRRKDAHVPRAYWEVLGTHHTVAAWVAVMSSLVYQSLPSGVATLACARCWVRLIGLWEKDGKEKPHT